MSRNKLIHSLVSAHSKSEQAYDSWSAVERQARSVALRDKLAAQHVARTKAAGTEESRQQLLKAGGELLRQLQRIVQHDASYASVLNKVQVLLGQLEQWDTSAPVGPRQGSLLGRVAFALDRVAEVAVKIAKIRRSKSVKRLAKVAATIRKISYDYPAGYGPAEYPEYRVPGPQQQPSQQTAPRLPPQINVRTLPHYLGKAVQDVEKALGPVDQFFGGSPAEAQYVQPWKDALKEIRDLLARPQATSASVVSAVNVLRFAMKKAANFAHQQGASASVITPIAHADWDLQRAASSVIEAEVTATLESVARVAMSLEGAASKSYKGKVAASARALGGDPSIKNLKLALAELVAVREEVRKNALMDMSDNGEDADDAEDITEKLDELDEDELAEALEESMDKAGSRIAKGKKKKKKKSPKKKTKKKKKKKAPPISDDPWAGKKQTFDSAYKKIDHARTQLARLIGKLSETSLVRGDVRYALSMVEKILEAMRRC